MTQRFSETFAEWVRETVESNDHGDDLYWDMGLSVVPAAQGMQVVPVVLVQMKSPIMGQVLGFQLVLSKGLLTTKEEIQSTVAAGIESLREARTAQLAETNGHVQPGPSGLHLP